MQKFRGLGFGKLRAPLRSGAAEGDQVFFNQAVSGLKGLLAIVGGLPA